MSAIMLGGWTWLLLLSLPSHSDSYSRGAPDTACTNKMIPRHGFDIQAGPPPAELLVDERAISHLDYLRVTIRTTAGPFKGFLVKAVEVVDTESPGGNAYADSMAIGSWYIPFSGDNSSLATVSSYVACNGVHQRAVTHSDARNPLTAVPLQWTPPHNFHGTVIITATIVSNYTHYWTNIQSLPVSVSSESDTTESRPEKSPAEDSSVEELENTVRSSTVHSENVLSDDELLELLNEVIQSKTTESTDVSVSTKNINNQNNQSKENNIDIKLLNSSSRGRSPRFENQHLYEKMEAEYGAWENSCPFINISSSLLIFCLLLFLQKTV